MRKAILFLSLFIGVGLIFLIAFSASRSSADSEFQITTYDKAYEQYGDSVIYNFVFPGGIRGGYNRPPSQALNDEHWRTAIDMLISQRDGNRSLAERLPEEIRANALTAAKEAEDALIELEAQGVIDCWLRHDCPSLVVESITSLSDLGRLAPEEKPIAPIEESMAPAEVPFALRLRPLEMVLNSYVVSSTQRAADITITFETTPVLPGYALNVDFYANDSDESRLGPGIYYSRRTVGIGVPADFPPTHNFPSAILPSLWNNGYLKRYSTKIMFGANVIPGVGYRILWRTSIGNAADDNGRIDIDAQWKFWDCGNVLCLGSIEATCTDFRTGIDYPDRFPAKNLIDTRGMVCYQNAPSMVYLPVVIQS